MSDEHINSFLLESQEAVTKISNELTLLQKDLSQNKKLINSIYRTLHTLKGSAGFLEFKCLEELSHSSETVLKHIRDNTLNPSNEMISLLNLCFKRMANILTEIEKTKIEPKQNNKELINRIDSLIESDLNTTIKASTQENNIGNRDTHKQSNDNTAAQAPMTKILVPISSLFDKFNTILNKLAQTQNKKVNLILDGEKTVMDSSFIDAIKDPLIHLIRNAIAHGIETTQERIAIGKNEVGTLRIKTYISNQKIFIEVTDDGKGINTLKVLEMAVLKDIISPEDSLNIRDENIVDLIFEPGLSTVENITFLSGRGVGLDIVKSSIESVGGKCSVFSKEGKVTTFILEIPLTNSLK